MTIQSLAIVFVICVCLPLALNVIGVTVSALSGRRRV